MKKTSIGIAVATALGAVSAAQAADVAVTLVSVSTESSNGSSAANVSNSTATWSYNTTSGIVTGTGLYKEQTQINPGN